ncbi:hypothetical protein HUU53_00320 [Candidatus Micrarchaeota archaeon]|nr:hypothetical protein [Candidatus Micrarchaeota archaeon]
MKKTKRKEKIKGFDKKLFEVVSSGVTNKKIILESLVVDEGEFDKRVSSLIKKKLFVYSGEDLKLGINAFDYFKEKPKKTKPKEESLIEKLSIPENPIVVQTPPKIEPETKEEPRIDLDSLLRSGAPKENVMQKTLEDKVLVVSSPQQLSAAVGKPLMTEGEEACELCKANFKLNVKNTSDSKYGHCFCGAAYHKDCYSALLNGTTRCVRCGRKLELVLDKQTEQALKGLRGVFD